MVLFFLWDSIFFSSPASPLISLKEFGGKLLVPYGNPTMAIWPWLF